MKAFLLSNLFIILVLLTICFVHFVDALSGRDWHVFVWAILTLLLLVVLIILLVSGAA